MLLFYQRALAKVNIADIYVGNIEHYLKYKTFI